MQTTSPPIPRGVLYCPACYVNPNVEEGSIETENLARICFCEKILPYLGKLKREYFATLKGDDGEKRKASGTLKRFLNLLPSGPAENPEREAVAFETFPGRWEGRGGESLPT